MHHEKIEISKKKRKLIEDLTAYAFLSPWIIGFILFSGLPIIASFALSLTKWNLTGFPVFIGLKNFIEMFDGDAPFLRMLSVTIEFTVLSVIVTIFWALFLAILLNNSLKGNSLFKSLIFTPAVIPSVALAYVFQLLCNKEVGVINYLLSFLGIKDGPNWLMDKHLVILTAVIACIFTFGTGQMMLIFSASLKEVPRELYEACEIDGGNFIQKFFYVTLPSISAVILFNLIVSTIGSLNGAFSLIFPLTDGGPAGASEVISLNIYHEGFRYFRMGYASAVSIALFILVAAISFLQFKLSNKYVHYES